MGTFTEQREISTYWYNRASDLRAAAAAVYYAIENESDFPKAEFGLSSDGRTFKGLDSLQTSFTLFL